LPTQLTPATNTRMWQPSIKAVPFLAWDHK
jgi:hypothetical protein